MPPHITRVPPFLFVGPEEKLRVFGAVKCLFNRDWAESWDYYDRALCYLVVSDLLGLPYRGIPGPWDPW